MSSPSMVHRSGDTLVVRSVVSGDQLYQDDPVDGDAQAAAGGVSSEEFAASLLLLDQGGGTAGGFEDDDDLDLPQCKIKRNYACTHCDFFSQNPRSYLYHLKDVHKQKIKVYECPSCLYASKHSQKLQRHVHMVHVMNKRGNNKKIAAAAAAAAATSVRKKPSRRPPVLMTVPRRRDADVGALLSAVNVKTEPGLGLKSVVTVVEAGPPAIPGELLTCNVCGFATRNANAMARHEKLVHLKKRFFRCTKCNYVTHMRARYTKHVKYHSMPMIKCDLCDFRTPYKWNLDRHYKNHQGDGAYKCSICNFTADIKQSLTVHEMNHHVPPVGQVSGASVGRRRNKVGASDSMQTAEVEIDREELELLRMERENDEDGEQGDGAATTASRPAPALQNFFQQAKAAPNRSGRNPRLRANIKKLAAAQRALDTDFVHPADGNVYLKALRLRCSNCTFTAAWPGAMEQHQRTAHGQGAAKKPARPIPNLIPIGSGAKSPPPAGGSNTGALPILRIPLVLRRVDKPMTAQDLDDICAQSCANSSLRDFASLMGGDVFDAPAAQSTPAEVRVKSEPRSEDEEELTENAVASLPSPIETPTTITPEAAKSPTPAATSTPPVALLGFKKKNASFFDKLKEKLLVGSGAAGGETCDLTCWCGHESKCLSEQMRHQKLHAASARDGARGKSSGGGTILTAGAELSSTRCQHCRQRCKTSADLVNHLQSCPDAKRALNATPASATTPSSATPTSATTPATGSLKSDEEDADDDEDVDVEDFEKKDDEETEEVAMDSESPEPPAGETGPHPMENKVFVWTSLPASEAAGVEAEADCEEDCLQGAASSPAASEGSLVGVETAPGYGAVTGSTAGDASASADGKPVKKVFKCPHCTFWASTASRFHVHIVGHLNKKPFECSLCAYRSNWRWDITKHIRLKSARDVNHETAGVLMTDETGRRNYSKYNKYLTLMRVHEPMAESSGSGRRTKPGSETPSPGKLPPPPQLTRAPSPSAARNPSTAGPLRPPPALRPAASRLRAATVTLRRPSGTTDTKKTLWKCKKCNFRDARRELVLAHVKEHYQQREAANHGRSTSPATTSATASSGASEASEGRGHAAFRCGHCQQVSNWKHVIQRHCRLKHSGDVKVVRGPGARNTTDDGSVEETSQSGSTDAGGLRQCEVCPFACLSAGEMSRHNEHHSSWPGASYRCTFCLYFVSHKRDLVSHLRLHGVADPEAHLARQRQVRASGGDAEDETESPRDSAEEPADELAAGGAASKRYRCAGCPYVSNSKSQFLYHKQFHRPRGAPFKCVRCSYNVSRRHLLHQHMRVHGVVVTPVKNASPSTPVKGDQDLDDNDQIEEVSLPSPRTSRSGSDNSRAPSTALDTRALPDIPLVWVSRGAKFFKMYKCRFCPHVNVRKANITEHEKMHSARTIKATPTSPSPNEGTDIKREPGTVLMQHRCPDCNYVCNNAGVLSSHAKVHQGVYGEVRCLFDATRSDESQLQELADSESMPAAPARAPAPQPAPPASTTPTTEPHANTKRLVFCAHCPARFLFPRELTIHARFHDAALSHRCQSCSYAARQRPHLLAHLKVHSEEYQRRTEEISAIYATSPLHPRPRAVLVDRDGAATWVVIGGAQSSQSSQPPRAAPYRADKHHECQLCPASFFKSVALQYHITLHGGAGPHRCRHCDYAVKTYGNLVKHEMIHGAAGGRRARARSTQAQPVPIDGAELFRHREQMQAQGLAGEAMSPAAPLHVDPQFGTLMHGNPQYTYPTYLKNGRLKEKRYKCHKCPSAFEKREQYKVHLSLHGSKQRYRCEKCDYSVKYYANYIQHTRKHSTGDVSRRTSAEDSDGPTSPEPSVSEQAPQRSAKSLCAARGNGPITLSVADRQSLLLQQLKRAATAGTAGSVVEEPRSFGCPHCPYASARRDGVESHVRRHVAVSGVRGAFLCDHCDYSVPHQHFLREHNKVHFGAAKRSPPEAFMRCSRMELFLAPDKENVVAPGDRTVVFADAGVSAAARFLPPLPPIAAATDGTAQRKVFVNELTGEAVDVTASKVKVEAVSDEEEEVTTNGASQGD